MRSDQSSYSPNLEDSQESYDESWNLYKVTWKTNEGMK